MSEKTVSASVIRENFAEYLDRVNSGRVLVTKHGRACAYLIGARELRALEETMAVLENDELLESIKKGLADIRQGRVRDAADVFAEIDGEFMDED